ncbi:MAG: TVP38/TMEM64 family protein [Oscillospiraceae bacterium]|nr:TVP38/TMEM64 family protein [Oscillospiraceae bacterium]
MPDNGERKVDAEIKDDIETVVESSTEDISEGAEKAAEKTAKAIEEKPPEKKKGGILKLIIVVAIIAAVVVVAFVIPVGAQGETISQMLALTPENLENIESIFSFIDGLGVIGYIVYIVIYIVAAVFMLPAFIFTVLAGAVFGPVVGAILALLAATIGATVAFIVARYIARDTMVERFGSSPLFNKIDNGLRQNGTSFLILTRLVPIFPYNVQNYIYGLTPIKLPTFIFVSLITMAPGAGIYAFIAGEIMAQLRRGEQPDFLRFFIILAIAGVILFLVSLIPKYIAKKKGIKINDE